MAAKNTNLAYGSVAKWLHWTTAVCFLCAYVSVYYGLWFVDPDSDTRRLARTLHTMFGISVGLLVLPRLVWRFINVVPDDEPGPRWQYLAAHYAHWVLYLFIILLPLTGWLGYGGRSINFFWLFEIPTFRGTALFDWLVVGQMGMDFDTFEKPIDYLHKAILGKWLAWMLIAVHIVAALYHHFHLRDKTLKKMIPFGRVDQTD